MDPTGNSLGATGQTALEVTNNVPGVNGFSQAKTQDFNITVTMPTNLNCTGGESLLKLMSPHMSRRKANKTCVASTGNVCTVRCRNNALAGPFGGCFAVQQTDTNVKTNVASKISTAQTLEGIQAQIQQNKVDLAAAVAANQVDGTSTQLDASKNVNQLLGISVVSKAAAVQTPAAVADASAAATTTAAASKNNGNKNNGNAAKGNGNAAKGQKNAA